MAAVLLPIFRLQIEGESRATQSSERSGIKLKTTSAKGTRGGDIFWGEWKAEQAFHLTIFEHGKYDIS